MTKNLQPVTASTKKLRRGQLDEDALGTLRDKDLMGRLFFFMKPYKWSFLGALVLLPIVSGLSLIQPQLLQTAIDKHFVPRSMEGFGWIAALMLAAIVGEFVARFAQSLLTQLAGERSLRDLRVAIFSHINTLSPSFFQRNPIGRLMTRLTTDIDSMNEALSSGVITIIADLISLFAIVIILLTKSVELTFVAFLVVPPLVLLTRWFRKLFREAFREARTTLARLNSALQESETGMAVIQLFAHEKRSRREYDDENRAYLRSVRLYVGLEAALFALVEMFSSIAVALILWHGVGLASQDAITLGALVAFIDYAQKFFVPIRDLSQKYTSIQSAMASAERIMHLLDRTEITPEDVDALPIKELKHSIEFRDVWFAYLGENWIIRGMSFTVARGEKVALVGSTGAGKSTIHALLTRMYDIQKGEILIDGIDIRRYRVKDLRRLFGVVLQDGFLFGGTMRQNITFGMETVTEEDVAAAANIVGLDRFVTRYSDGFDHEVRERGRNLSAGERQLVCFTRALAHRPEVLVLDEATANIDTETERLIQEAIERMLERQTSIVVAHRLSTIQKVDRILVLHKGQLVESGTHDELVEHGGFYARLVRLNYAQIAR